MKVSVVVPCFNQGRYVSECIDSLVAQTYDDWECIIVDDGSTDDSVILTEHRIKDDLRFTLIKQSNKGVSAARNTGIENAIGKYILPLDADDSLSNNYLEVCVRRFLELPNVSLVYGKVKKFGHQNGFWSLKPYNFESLLQENMIHCSALFLKTDWERIGGYDEFLKVGLEDWEFYINLLNKDSIVIYAKECTLHYRTKDTSRNNSFTQKERLEIKKYVGQKHLHKYYSVISNLPDYIAKNHKEAKRLELLSRSKKNALYILLNWLNIFNRKTY